MCHFHQFHQFHDPALLEVFKEVAFCNNQQKRNMPLSPAEVLLLVAVKGVPSLRKLDTNPEVPMPAAENLEHFKTFKDDRVVDTTSDDDETNSDEDQSTAESDEEYDSLCRAVQQNPGEVMNLLMMSRYRSHIKALLTVAKDEEAEQCRAAVRRAVDVAQEESTSVKERFRKNAATLRAKLAAAGKTVPPAATSYRSPSRSPTYLPRVPSTRRSSTSSLSSVRRGSASESRSSAWTPQLARTTTLPGYRSSTPPSLRPTKRSSATAESSTPRRTTRTSLAETPRQTRRSSEPKPSRRSERNRGSRTASSSHRQDSRPALQGSRSHRVNVSDQAKPSSNRGVSRTRGGETDGRSSSNADRPRSHPKRARTEEKDLFDNSSK